MTLHCTGCGNEVDPSNDFCPNCGEQISTDNLEQETSETTFEIEISNTEKNRYYNLDNIAFIEERELDWTQFTYALSVIPLLLSVGVFFIIKEILILLVGIIGTVFIYFILAFGNKIEQNIGTLTNVDSYSGSNNDVMSQIRDELNEIGYDYISLSHDDSTIIKIDSYDYYFVLDKITKIDRSNKNYFRTAVIITIILVSFGLFSALVGDVAPWIKSALIFMIVAPCIIMLIFTYGLDTLVTIDVQGGEEEKFWLTNEDAEKLAEEFKRK